jgi:hypothetical protein
MKFYLMSVGLTIILSDALILEPFKKILVKIYSKILDTVEAENQSLWTSLHCPMCCGFWTGLIFGAITRHPMFEAAILTSFFGYVTGVIIDKLSR